jgi:hypothetical protein
MHKKPPMKLNFLTAVALLTSLGLTTPDTLVAQTPPASTYRPGFWQPIARVDLNRPLSIKIINQTDIPLEYDFTNTPDVAPQSLAADSSIIIEEQLPIPAYLLINRSSFSQTSEQSAFNLKFEVVVSEDNVVNVKVMKVNKDTPGYSTVNLHETGAIYIY